MTPKHLEGELPGAELVEQGLADLAQDRVTDFSLLVLIAAPRLKQTQRRECLAQDFFRKHALEDRRLAHVDVRLRRRVGRDRRGNPV